MPIIFRSSFRVETRQASRPRGVRVLAGTALLAMAAALLWIDSGFADYMVTGLFWNQTQGTVVEARNSSVPTVEFSTADGVTRDFKEDYILLCGGSRRFCWIRDFTLGQQVPVVYKPKNPSRAYIHDEALYGSVLGFLADADVSSLLLLMVLAALRHKPIQTSVQFNSGEIES